MITDPHLIIDRLLEMVDDSNTQYAEAEYATHMSEIDMQLIRHYWTYDVVRTDRMLTVTNMVDRINVKVSRNV